MLCEGTNLLLFVYDYELVWFVFLYIVIENDRPSRWPSGWNCFLFSSEWWSMSPSHLGLLEGPGTAVMTSISPDLDKFCDGKESIVYFCNQITNRWRVESTTSFDDEPNLSYSEYLNQVEIIPDFEYVFPLMKHFLIVLLFSDYFYNIVIRWIFVT